MTKVRCKNKKEKEITNPKFQCLKCKQVAKKKKNLCLPEKL
jgi:hypothetical protein